MSSEDENDDWVEGGERHEEIDLIDNIKFKHHSYHTYQSTEPAQQFKQVIDTLVKERKLSDFSGKSDKALYLY